MYYKFMVSTPLNRKDMSVMRWLCITNLWCQHQGDWLRPLPGGWLCITNLWCQHLNCKAPWRFPVGYVLQIYGVNTY